MNNELAKDILQMIEHANNNIDVKLIEGIKNLCIAAKNKQILNKNG